MNLTTDQQHALAQRIYSEFGNFVTEELKYQIEDMKDNDLLNWDYYSNPEDESAIISLVREMVTAHVPVL